MTDEQSLDRRNDPISEDEMASLEKCANLREALENLQGNILRGHGRKRSVNLFLRFKKGEEREVRARIRRIAEDGTVTSALTQRAQNKKWEEDPNHLFCSFFLSAKGYEYLNLHLEKEFSKFSKEFRGGLKGARARWNDAPEAWEKADEYDFHAMVLLAQADPNMLNDAVQCMERRFEPVTEGSPQKERGKAMEVNGRPVEHFGFADNISQPLFFQEDIRKHTHGSGTHAWDPSAGPSLVLVQDPFGGENACGSYLVFLKLEQNAQDFALKVQELAIRLGIAAEKIQAFVMGRFQDGTPVVLQNTTSGHGDLNNFSFFPSDADGTKCPYYAHIRKVNPRDDTASSRERRIARRGITYGYRKKEPKDNPSPEEMPRDGVGLLFMSYQRDIKKQFEYLQFVQANNVDFFKKNSGVDPIIGRMGREQPPQKWPAAWGAPRIEQQPLSFGSFVTPKGGEYFFAPSMSFLKRL